jgi:hypothetical protein
MTTNKAKIILHQATGWWSPLEDSYRCVKIKCDKCNKVYHINSGKAIAKHEQKCNRKQW